MKAAWEVGPHRPHCASPQRLLQLPLECLSDPYSVSQRGSFAWADEPHDPDSLPSPRLLTSDNPNPNASKSFPAAYSQHPLFSTDFKDPSLLATLEPQRKRFRC